MRIQFFGIFIALLTGSVTSFADVEAPDLFYTNYSEKVLSGRVDFGSLQEEDFFFSPGLKFLLIEQQMDEQGVKWIRLGFENENWIETETSNDIWIRAEDFATLDIIEDTAARITYCYRYVKKYLLSKGFVKVYLPGASAYMAAKILPQYGFNKTNRKPGQASIYDVCVYKGGPSGHGHIEVRDPKGWYYGYGYKAQPIKNRTFISCFYKKLK